LDSGDGDSDGYDAEGIGFGFTVLFKHAVFS
jgi:hypothetical protein